MIEFVTNMEDFWSHGLETHHYHESVEFANMKNGLHWHDNFKHGHLLQSFGHDLPVPPQKFVTSLGLDQDTSTVSWICLRPNQFIAPHVDHFYGLIHINKVPIDVCVRYLVFLQDWEFGQMADFQAMSIRNWRRGDTWKFNYLELHWAGNASNMDLHTCQVNAIVNNKER